MLFLNPRLTLILVLGVSTLTGGALAIIHGFSRKADEAQHRVNVLLEASARMAAVHNTESHLRAARSQDAEELVELDNDYRRLLAAEAALSEEREHGHGLDVQENFVRFSNLMGKAIRQVVAGEWAAAQRTDEALEPYGNALDWNLEKLVDAHREEAWVAHDREAVATTGSVVALGLLLSLGSLAAGRRARVVARLQTTEAERRATHDPLTDLPNRLLLDDRLDQAIATARRTGAGFSVLLLDLDGFKDVNDSLGHRAGDLVLCEIGRRLSALVRSSDTVARLGGDEFAILLADTEGADKSAAFVGRLLAALREPLEVDGAQVRLTTSVGIVNSTRRSSKDEMLRNADLSMYIAKQSSGDSAVHFEPEMYAKAVERAELMADLHTAIEERQFVLHYQPVVDSADGRVAKLEALIRWNHPERGLLAPGAFIEIAEQGGLIQAVGEWVLEEACRQLSEWRATGDFDEIKVAVNVSPAQLLDPRFAGGVLETLRAHAVPADRLVVEITETLLLDSAETAAIHELRAGGVRIAMDDFGTGYSSLSRVATMPIDYLKVDRSFVSETTLSARNPLTATIVAMGHALGLTVVAEGVETAEQLTVLKGLGCHLLQGFLFSRPVPARDVSALVAAGVDVDVGGPLAAADLGEAEARLGELISRVLEGDRDPDAVVPLVLAELKQILGMDTVYLTSIDREDDEQRVVTATPPGALGINPGLALPWSQTLCRRVLADDRQYVADAQESYPDVSAARTLGIRSFLSVPVRDQDGNLVGTLCGASRSVVDLHPDAPTLLELFARSIQGRLGVS